MSKNIKENNRLNQIHCLQRTYHSQCLQSLKCRMIMYQVEQVSCDQCMWLDDIVNVLLCVLSGWSRCLTCVYNDCNESQVYQSSHFTGQSCRNIGMLIHLAKINFTHFHCWPSSDLLLKNGVILNLAPLNAGSQDNQEI